jgi:hypothetical protein
MVESLRGQGFTYAWFREEERKGSTWVAARVGVAGLLPLPSFI